MRSVKDIFTQNAHSFERLLESEKRRGQLSRRRLTAIVILILLMLNVSHCSEQTGINRTVRASEKTEVNTNLIVVQQKKQIDELNAYRMADSVEIEARNMLINDLEKTLSYLVDSSKLLETKALSDIGREVRADRMYVAAIKDWQDVNVGRISRLTDSIFKVLKCKTDTVFLTRRDTVYATAHGRVVEYVKTGNKNSTATATPLATATPKTATGKQGIEDQRTIGRRDKPKRLKKINTGAQSMRKTQRKNQRKRERKLSR